MRNLFLYIACVIAIGSVAQDTTYALGQVEVFVSKVEQEQRILNQELLKYNSTMPFSDLLQKQSGVFIKNQGPNSLSTLSYRGLGSMHIPLIIAGQNMQSSMNGNMDLGLISSFHFDMASFRNTKPELGEVSLGPSLNLDQKYREPGFDWMYSENNWNRKHIGFKSNFMHKKWNYSASALALYDPYQWEPGNYSNEEISDFRPEGNARGVSVFQRIGYVSDKLEWNNSFYMQSSHRSITGTYFSNSDARQFDHNMLFANDLKKKVKKWNLSINNAVWREKINFSSALSSIYAKSEVWNINTLLKGVYRHNSKTSISPYLSCNYATYTSTMLLDQANRTRGQQGFRFSHEEKKYYFIADNGLQLSEHPTAWFASFTAGRKSKLGYNQLNLHKSYRLPTFNEIYWYEPGYAMGNPDLLPETGYAIQLDNFFRVRNWDLKLSPFAGKYSNMILWRPTPVLMPVNIRTVLTSGIETTLSARFKLPEAILLWKSNVHLVKSVYASSGNGMSEGKQLIYTPVITANSTLSYQSDIFGCFANAQYVGKNYYSSDNSFFIEPYYLIETGVYASYKGFRTSILITNLMDKGYFTVLNYPLPGRTIHIQINYHLTFKNEKI